METIGDISVKLLITGCLFKQKYKYVHIETADLCKIAVIIVTYPYVSTMISID